MARQRQIYFRCHFHYRDALPVEGSPSHHAQRDYFGAHTYERTDLPRGEFHHTDWIGSGAFVKSGSYSA